MRRTRVRPRETAVVITGLALLATLDVQAHAPVAIRAPAGLLLALLLPGAAWLQPNPGDRQALETAALVVAASMGIAMVTGLLLDVMPGGLTDRSWSVGLLVVTLAGTGRHWLQSVPRFRLVLGSPTPASPVPRAVPAHWPARRLALFIGGCLTLVALLGLLAWVSVASNTASYRREHFTVLSLNATSADVLVVGIEDHEESTVRYRLTAVSQGKTVFTQRVTLDSGAAVSVPVRLPADTVLLDARLHINLYRAGRAGVYRSLSLEPHGGRWL